jgi:hypothetical protein
VRSNAWQNDFGSDDGESESPRAGEAAAGCR